MPSRDAFFGALGSLPPGPPDALLTALRWPDGVICPNCGGAGVGGHGRYRRCPALPRYRCKAYGHTFILTTGTPLAPGRVLLPHWVVIAWLNIRGHKGEPESTPNPLRSCHRADARTEAELAYGTGWSRPQFTSLNGAFDPAEISSE
jgi:Transposase zinc-ribbon domain